MTNGERIPAPPADFVPMPRRRAMHRYASETAAKQRAARYRAAGCLSVYVEFAPETRGFAAHWLVCQPF